MKDDGTLRRDEEFGLVWCLTRSPSSGHSLHDHTLMFDQVVSDVYLTDRVGLSRRQLQEKAPPAETATSSTRV